jgi:hypothetical protein
MASLMLAAPALLVVSDSARSDQKNRPNPPVSVFRPLTVAPPVINVPIVPGGTAGSVEYVRGCAEIEAPHPKVSSGCDETRVCQLPDGSRSRVCVKWSIIY